MLSLQGHKDIAQYALDWNKSAESVASGGKDMRVLVWELDDYQTSLSTKLILNNRRELNSINNRGEFSNIKLSYRYDLKGHEKTVEDVSFCPKNNFCLASVGDDRKLMIWDTRVDKYVAHEFVSTHADDLNCVDWNWFEDYTLAIGSNDGTISVYDIRSVSNTPLVADVVIESVREDAAW